MHTLESAPAASQPQLIQSRKANGSIPNLHAVMAEAPGLLVGYRTVGDLFVASRFSNEETTVVWQTINVENGYIYCVPAHTAIAKAMKVDDRITQALRDGTPLPTPRLEALCTFTLAVMRQRGVVEDAVMDAVFEAGFTQRQVLEVVLGLAQRVMSNYTNHLAKTPLDARFQRFAWQKTS